MDDKKHKIPTVGCQDVTAKDIVDEHFSVAAYMFLANWRELELGMIQNLDQLMDNIHTLYEDLDTEELLFIKVSKLILLGCDFFKNHPLYILYDDVFNKEKLRDEMGIIYNKWKKRGEKRNAENVTEVLTKKMKMDENIAKAKSITDDVFMEAQKKIKKR